MAKCFAPDITPQCSEQYHMQKQRVPPRQTGEASAVRSTKATLHFVIRTPQVIVLECDVCRHARPNTDGPSGHTPPW